MKYLYLLLTFAAAATAVWYIAFYEPSTPGATYQDTYAYVSIGAACIFAGLFAANFINREKARPKMMLEE